MPRALWRSLSARFRWNGRSARGSSRVDWALLGVCVLSAICLLIGWVTHIDFIAGGGAAGMCFVALQTARGMVKGRKRTTRAAAAGTTHETAASTGAAAVQPPEDIEGLAAEMLAQGRFALLLRPQIRANLNQDRIEEAWEQLEDGMALVPDGEVWIGQSDDSDDVDYEILPRGRVVRVQQFYLDRYPVTNRQFQKFVNAGGYEQMALWDQQIWPGVLDFVDQTGLPGPKYWQGGRFPKGLDEHPVVGVSWFECAAYARWVGKRLPTDPEWEKAASWPVELVGSRRPGRRFPWGNAMDRARCNVWGSEHDAVAAAGRFEAGVSVGGVYDLVGNVWEWTSGKFGASGYPARQYLLPGPMRSIRGGAYDTYFESHATCQFQSGEDPVARKHNISFRCAVSVCDLADLQAPPAENAPAEPPPTETQSPTSPADNHEAVEAAP